MDGPGGPPPQRGVRKATPKGQMSGSGMGPAITHLPYHLKMLFEPNPPLEYMPPIVKRKMPPYTGLTEFAGVFETTNPPARIVQETPLQRKERLRKEKAVVHTAKLEEIKAQWNPETDKAELKTEDAYKTLFVGRISYETTEKQLRREFERYGDIHKIRLVEDEDGKSRGYAFIEFKEEAAMKAAYKNADGKKIDGRRIVVDVERGRTVRDWKPRKLGGGIGGTRLGGAAVNLKYSGREVIRSSNGPSTYGGGGMGRPADRPRSRSRGRDDRRAPPPSRYGGPPMDRRPMERRSRSRSRDRRRRPPSRSRSRSRPRGNDRRR
ncbi:U1 small nuclear ribonucleoprotein 70 kDa-like [Achlya hypogyna]|uniref:U1 small nuclear ribonucleoprotein 70 kDa n=1 Tax=Achlya hypogyna TaxID=1202772 RepID=A0A1V9ZF71_ACHHY|nr:U1 small nuclear ribonucleoprotein 70 kDa-like [Achlya hypogyna]